MAHFIEIVVLSGHPENGHGRNARFAKLLRQPNRRERLVNRIRRPAKHTDLLPAHHRNGAALELLKITRRRSASAERSVLLAQNASDFAPALSGVIEPRRNFPHRIHIRRMRVKLPHTGVVINQADKQLGLVRQAPKRNRDTAHRHLDYTHAPWLNQIRRPGTWSVPLLDEEQE